MSAAKRRGFIGLVGAGSGLIARRDHRRAPFHDRQGMALGVAALQAAARNQLQRAVNLSLGSALSTIGLTVPVVLAISVWSGSPLELGLPPLEIVLLATTLFLC